MFTLFLRTGELQRGDGGDRDNEHEAHCVHVQLQGYHSGGQEQSQLHLGGQLPQVRNRVRQPSLLPRSSQLQEHTSAGLSLSVQCCQGISSNRCHFKCSQFQPSAISTKTNFC